MNDEELGAALASVNEATVAIGNVRDELADLTKEVREQHDYGRRNRTLIRWLVGFAFAIVVLLAAVTRLEFAVQGNKATISQLHHSQVAGCANGNDFRSGQTEIWERFIAVIVPPSAPSETHREASSFLGYVEGVNHPRNCRKAYPIH